MYVLILSDEKRIAATTDERFVPTSHVVLPEGTTIEDFPEEYTIVDGPPDNYVTVEQLPEGNLSDYRYVDGEYVYDPLPVPEEPETEISVWDELDAAYREGVDSV